MSEANDAQVVMVAFCAQTGEVLAQSQGCSYLVTLGKTVEVAEIRGRMLDQRRQEAGFQSPEAQSSFDSWLELANHVRYLRSCQKAGVI